jgi:putative nucleotidyltransferase with HDIG domain
MINARSLADNNDNDVIALLRPMASFERLGSAPSPGLSSQTVPVVVLAERVDLGAAAVAMLSELGFVVAYPQDAFSVADLQHGFMLIVGDHFAPGFLADVLTGPWTAHLERVVLFGNQIGIRTLAALDEIGFRFIVKSLPTPVRLTRILAAIDSSMVAAGQSTIARRIETSATIEAGSNRLFEHIRTGNLGAAVSEAKAAFNHFEALLDSAAASHWLSVIQQYHDGTAQHCSLVSAVAMLFARSLGFSQGDQRRLFEAAHFHDVGKVRVPLFVLDKPGSLDADERTIMETHAKAGYDIITHNDVIAGEIAEVARDHHEYLDGTGYPRGISGGRIADITRVITICDIFAALIERRPYKQPKTAREAYSILQSLGGKLDPSLLRSFSKIADSCSPD